MTTKLNRQTIGGAVKRLRSDQAWVNARGAARHEISEKLIKRPAVKPLRKMQRAKPAVIFRPDVKLDPSQVEDRRGVRGHAFENPLPIKWRRIIAELLGPKRPSREALDRLSRFDKTLAEIRGPRGR